MKNVIFISVYSLCCMFCDTRISVPIISLSGCKDTDSARTISVTPAAGTYTPEQFGATADGTVHKLNERFKTLEEAQKIYPGVKDLDVTLDGAAFQKAINMATIQGGTVIAEGKYVTNYPLVTKNNIIIDGRNKGFLKNDRSREKQALHFIFYFGNYNAVAFNKKENNDAGFLLYDVAGGIKAGQQSVQLSRQTDMASFKEGQLVMLASSALRKQGDKKILLPYHITVSKIIKKESNKLFFEYPVDETIDSLIIAANGNDDFLAEIPFEGVENVTLRNMSFDGEHITARTYAYKCTLENLYLENGVRLIGVNAFSRSTIRNISGTFGWRGIEIKTGTHDLLLQNIRGVYKPIEGYTAVNDMISLGEYCRKVTIDSFEFDCKDAVMRHGLITMRARNNVLSNGKVVALSQKKPFIEFFNERYVSQPTFACFGNLVKNVSFYGSSQMRNILSVGDDPTAEKEGPLKKNPTDAFKEHKKKNKQTSVEESDDEVAYTFTENIAPQNNRIENCLFDAGFEKSVAMLFDGRNNTIKNCRFTKAVISGSAEQMKENIISQNN